MPSGGVSLGALGLIAGGVVLAYAGVNDPDGGPVGVVRSVLSGQLPTPGAQQHYNDPGALGGAAGSAAGRAAGALTRGSSGVRARYDLGPVRKDVEQIAYIVGPKFGLETIGGWRRVDQFPDHPEGRALDFMIDDVPNGNGKAVGDAIAAFLIANAKAFRVDYIIWWRHSWNPKRGTWEPYTSTSNPHTDHVHLSVKR